MSYLDDCEARQARYDSRWHARQPAPNDDVRDRREQQQLAKAATYQRCTSAALLAAKANASRITTREDNAAVARLHTRLMNSALAIKSIAEELCRNVLAAIDAGGSKTWATSQWEPASFHGKRSLLSPQLSSIAKEREWERLHRWTANEVEIDQEFSEDFMVAFGWVDDHVAEAPWILGGEKHCGCLPDGMERVTVLVALYGWEAPEDWRSELRRGLVNPGINLVDCQRCGVQVPTLGGLPRCGHARYSPAMTGP